MSSPYSSTSNLIHSTPYTTPSLTSRSTCSSSSDPLSSFSRSAHGHPPRDFAAAFAQLQMVYGPTGAAPTPLHVLSPTPSAPHSFPTSTSGKRKKSLKERFFLAATPAPAAYSEMAEGEAAKNESGDDLKKDYEKASAVLQSQFGAGGMGQCIFTTIDSNFRTDIAAAPIVIPRTSK